MWSFFSRDTSKDFPYEIVDNVAGKRSEKLKNTATKLFSSNFPIFLLFLLNLCFNSIAKGFEEKSIWSLKRGKRKASDEQVSIFTYEIKSGSEATFELAKQSLKRIKTLRHPSILQFLDSFENDKVIYVATEFVEPLGMYLRIPSDCKRDMYLSWGIFQITVSLCQLLSVIIIPFISSSVHYHF